MTSDVIVPQSYARLDVNFLPPEKKTLAPVAIMRGILATDLDIDNLVSFSLGCSFSRDESSIVGQSYRILRLISVES
jgi:hypothetical protein